MADLGFLSGLIEAMQTHSPLLGRLWLQIMLVFRIVILGTVATDLFEDEQEQFECNTAQPGCKQVCYDQAFPISQYRFWVFHIVLISTPAMLFLMYAIHRRTKTKAQQQGAGSGDVRGSRSSLGKRGVNTQEELKELRLYTLNVGFRFLAEVAFLVGQWALYGFGVAAQYPCSRFPCPYTVDCFTSRPMEKTVFLVFYFAVGLLSALFSLAELVHLFFKWRRLRRRLGRRGDAGQETGDAGGDQGRTLRTPAQGSRGGTRGQLFSGRGRSGGSNSSRGSGGKGRGSLGRSSSQRIDTLMV
ncbi:gap junction delta-3 protein-like [Alosa pseudoharengus]|uniref:gap junction delta-3 protein-like n=1 Tax=Alosa pseudoharengus TaxID=34774 RepID=UPI003F8BEECC